MIHGPHLPNPGSDDALKLGCSCPVLDNGHGYGYGGMKGVFAWDMSCPLHRDEILAEILEGEAQRRRLTGDTDWSPWVVEQEPEIAAMDVPEDPA